MGCNSSKYKGIDPRMVGNVEHLPVHLRIQETPNPQSIVKNSVRHVVKEKLAVDFALGSKNIPGAVDDDGNDTADEIASSVAWEPPDPGAFFGLPVEQSKVKKPTLQKSKSTYGRLEGDSDHRPVGASMYHRNILEEQKKSREAKAKEYDVTGYTVSGQPKAKALRKMKTMSVSEKYQLKENETVEQRGVKSIHFRDHDMMGCPDHTGWDDNIFGKDNG